MRPRLLSAIFLSGRDEAHGHAQALALAEGVHAEARDLAGLEGEVALALLLVLALGAGRGHLHEHGLDLLLGDGVRRGGDQVAVDAQEGGAAGAHVQVGGALVDQRLEQLLEGHRSFLTFRRR
jgi:hypothetical protein